MILKIILYLKIDKLNKLIEKFKQNKFKDNK